MTKLFKCLLVSFLLTNICLAEDVRDLSLKRDIGARYVGMGGAATAIAEDGSALFYNPANLAQPGFSYTYSYPDVEQKQTAGTTSLIKAAYLGYGVWGLQDKSGNSIQTQAIGFGNKNGWLNWGFNYKQIGWTQSGIMNSGWSSDVGVLARVTPQIKVGFLLQDIVKGSESISPSSARLGFGYTPTGGQFVLAGDAEISNNLQPLGHLGAELKVVDGFALRAGMDRSDPTAGASLDFGVFDLDYAALFSPAGETIHKVEIGIRALPQKDRPHSLVKPKEYALIDVAGALKGGRSEYSFLGGVHPGVDSILSQIRRASKDSGIDGIMIRMGGFNTGLGGMAMVQELREELLRAKQSGKKIVAFLDGGAMGDEYYLVSMADKIVAPPGAGIGGFGKSISIMRLEGLFEKFGIEWQIICQGKYKDTFHQYNDKMTADQKVMVENLVADLHRQLLTDISNDRKINIEKIKIMGEGNIYTAQEAKKKGLIDEVGYFKDARKIAAQISGDEKEEAKMIQPSLVMPEESFLANVSGIAVIEIDGEIVSGGGGENVIFGGSYVGSDTIVKFIRQASDDMFIKAIILRINSPGGGAVAAGEIYEAMQYARDKNKVIIASIGDLGASGGYYIACAADKIVADPSSLVGSIGVIGYFPTYEKLMKKLNVKADVIKEGKHADMFSGMRKLTTEEVGDLNRMQAEAYREFLAAVSIGRKMPTKDVIAAAEGQIFTGSKALSLKLIDYLGGFSDAVDLTKKEAGIGGEVRLVFYHTPSMFFPFSEGQVEFKALAGWLQPILLPNLFSPEQYN
ncbi:MAG: signal peptide peptidase SppA [Candidatus Margulisiibacteriota bacterium]